ncbi:MAG: ABC transporter ATP-binding protein [Bacteroidales bacterium]|nr:ABC transporter ATP-binding protein [Bacteroidales bacterium]
MVKVENLTFHYNSHGAAGINDLSLRLETGNIYGLLGLNGAGKSTLLYLMAGLLRPQSGSVMVAGENVARRLPVTLEKIFVVPEEFDLPRVTFQRYVELNAGFYPRFSMDDLRRHLTTMELDYNVNLGALSMGQKKKALMCFALACNTEVLLMDEPTNGLDIPSKSAFRRFVVSGNSDERVILISTHQVKDIDKVLDHVIVMDSGSIVLNRSVAEITEKLDFHTSADGSSVTDALYTRRGLGGYDVIERNESGDFSELNLETLFDFAVSNRNSLYEIFDNNGKDAEDE